MKNYYITTVLLILCGFTFSQNKKEQIATLTIQSDSLKQVILVERGITASKVSGLEQEISNLRKEMVSVQKELTQAKIALLEQEKASINKQLAFDERERNLLDSISFLEKQLRALKLNSYESVTIGNQVWMTKNLNVDKFRNGDLIQHAKTDEDWEKAGQNGEPAWCYYNNDPSNGEKYGKLYNWFAVNDSRGLAPDGWHVPTDAEWTVLTDYLGSQSVAGGKIKSTGTQYWSSPNKDATNESGFSGLPGGYRGDDGTFSNIGYGGHWWSSSEFDTNSAWYRYLDYGIGNVYRNNSSKGGGFSVRCLRD